MGRCIHFFPSHPASPCLRLPLRPPRPGTTGAGAELEAGRADTVAKSPLHSVGPPSETEEFWGCVRSPSPCPGGMGGHLGPHLFPGLHLSMGDWGVPGAPAQRCLGPDCTPGPAHRAPSPCPCDPRSRGAFLPPQDQPRWCRSRLTSGRPRRRGSPRWPAAACAGAGSCTRPGPAPGPRRSGSAAPVPQKGGH